MSSRTTRTPRLFNVAATGFGFTAPGACCGRCIDDRFADSAQTRMGLQPVWKEPLLLLIVILIVILTEQTVVEVEDEHEDEKDFSRGIFSCVLRTRKPDTARQ